MTPFSPAIPWREGGNEVSAPRVTLPLSPPSQGQRRDHQGFVCWSLGTWQRGTGGRPAKGMEGRVRDTSSCPGNSPGAQQDLAAHSLPSPPGKAKSSLSDGGEQNLGLGQGRRDPCPPWQGCEGQGQPPSPSFPSLLCPQLVQGLPRNPEMQQGWNGNKDELSWATRS